LQKDLDLYVQAKIAVEEEGARLIELLENGADLEKGRHSVELIVRWRGGRWRKFLRVK
jgi:hypothetical protein